MQKLTWNHSVVVVQHQKLIKSKMTTKSFWELKSFLVKKINGRWFKWRNFLKTKIWMHAFERLLEKYCYLTSNKKYSSGWNIILRGKRNFKERQFKFIFFFHLWSCYRSLCIQKAEDEKLIKMLLNSWKFITRPSVPSDCAISSLFSAPLLLT